MQLSEKSKFDSVILAGGFGTRLAPLTDCIPKPMLPVNGESALQRALRMLRSQNFNSTAITTMYLPERIESMEFNKGHTEFFRESKPLGSAGAVAMLKDRLEDSVLILSGDAVWDYDLEKAKNQFRESGCDAGIILCRTHDAGEYGSVCLYKGLVTQFCEKPSVRDTLSDLINTGIYFLSKKAVELIPCDRAVDFAHDLFPAMLSRGMTIAGIEPMGHWFDIGSFGDYHRCNMWLSEGENCIGKKANIHNSAKITHSVIMDNCTIGNSTLRGCIVGENVVIGNDCIIPSGCVISSNAELRDGTALSPGTVIGTGEMVAGESHYDCFPKPGNALVFDDDCIVAEEGDDGYFVRLGRLLGGDGNVIAYAEGSNMTLPHACELSCGASEVGSVCTVISGGNDAIAAFAASEYRSKTAFIAQRDGRIEIRLFNQKGMPFSREELRALTHKKAVTAEKPASVFLLPHGALIKRYLFHLKARAFIPKRMNISDDIPSSLLNECANELEIGKSSEGAVFRITDNGEKAVAKLPSGREIGYWQLLTACCIEGKRELVTLPRDTPDAVEQILKRHSVTVKFYGDNQSNERRLAEYDRLHRDGILLAITAAGLAEKKGITVEEMVDRLPPFSVTTRTVFADKEKMASIIASIRADCGNTRCAGFDFGDGKADIIPCAAGRFRIIASAMDSETAEEISLRAIDKLTK